MSDFCPLKPKRRWFQFSLKTLLIGVFVVSVPLAAFVWRREGAATSRGR